MLYAMQTWEEPVKAFLFIIATHTHTHTHMFYKRILGAGCKGGSSFACFEGVSFANPMNSSELPLPQ